MPLLVGEKIPMQILRFVQLIGKWYGVLWDPSGEKLLHMCMVIITVLSLYINIYGCFIICWASGEYLEVQGENPAVPQSLQCSWLSGTAGISGKILG